jgi:hypothetical protein
MYSLEKENNIIISIHTISDSILSTIAAIITTGGGRAGSIPAIFRQYLTAVGTAILPKTTTTTMANLGIP